MFGKGKNEINEIWESLKDHRRELDKNKEKMNNLFEINSNNNLIIKELIDRMDKIPKIDFTPINKRCVEIENALLMINSQILELKNVKPVDIKVLVEPLIQEFNSKLEEIDNKVKTLDEDRTDILRRIEELKPKQEPLTENQQRVLNLMKEGKAVKEIAEESKVSIQSIYNTIKVIKLKGYEI